MKQQVTFAQAIEAANRGDAAAARDILKQLVSEDPQHSRAWMLLAEVAKTPEYAINCLGKVLVLEPENALARERQAQLRAGQRPSGALAPSGSSAPSVNALQRFLGEQQDPAAVQHAYTTVSQILTPGEEIHYIAVQSRPVLTISPDCIVLTNKRFIIYRTKLLGGADFDDYIWRDLRDAKLKEGMIGATITMKVVTGQVLTLEYLPKVQARRIYQAAQAMEEHVREERRQREMEERRAGAQNIVLSSPLTNPLAPPVPPAPPALPPALALPEPPITQPATEDPVETLKKLKTLLTAELISQSEYDAKKVEILARM